MNKFSIVLLTTALTLGSGAVMAESNNGSTNEAADAGAAAGGAVQKIAPNNVSNSKINNTGDATSSTHTTMKHHKKMTASQIHKNSECKDGKCPNINNKVGHNAKTNTDGTTQ